MSNINSAFTIRNDQNTFGRILSGGTNLTNIFLLSGSSAASLTNAITFNTTGGAPAGTTYDGSAIKTIDYSTVGASPLAGSTSIVTVGTITTGTWSANTISIAKGGTNSTTALNNNRVMQSSGGAIVEAAAITASRALVSDGNGIPVASATTSTELGYVSGVTSAIQTQLSNRVTSVGATSPVASSGGTTPTISLNTAYGDTINPYGSKTANYFLAAPNGSAGVPSFRAVVAADIPTLNQNTTGSAATLTTSRNIWGQSFNGSADVTGNLSNVGNITGTGAITIASGSSTNGNIAISPDGSGTVNISKANITGGAITGTTISGSTGSFTSATVGGDLTVGGTLYLQGSAIYENSNSLIVKNPVIYLAEDNPNDIWDIGIVGHTVTSNGYGHTGLLRGHPSTFNSAGSAVGTWYLFSSMVLEPSSNNVANNAKVIDTLVANTSGSHTGNASTATALAANTTFNFYGGDLYSPSSLYNGTQNISFAPILSANTVTYSKIQQVAANSLLGNTTASLANVAAVSYSTAGLTVLQGTAAQGATALGLGTGNAPTFQGVITTGSSGSSKTLAQNYYATGTSSAPTITTVPVANYTTAKFLVKFVNTGSNSPTNQSGVAEILAHYDGANWNYTIYGFIDPYGIIQNTSSGITVSAASTTLDINFNFLASYSYLISVYCLALI